MLSSADINALDLAHTHAQSAKKKGALETVFINLYEKYKQGEVLDKVEERAIKDYLAVYRSEFALLKKQAKMKNNADKIIDKQTSAEKKAAEEKLRADYKKVQSDLKELQEKLVKLTEDLEAEKKEKSEILIKADKLTKAVINASPILLKSFQDIIFDKKLDFDTEEKNAISALFMIALGFIPIEKIKNYVENYGSITINEKVYFKCTKYTEKYVLEMAFIPVPNGFEAKIHPVIFMRERLKDNKISSLEKSLCIISQTSTAVDVVKDLINYRISVTSKPEIYNKIDYDRHYRFINRPDYVKHEPYKDLIIEKMGIDFEKPVLFVPISHPTFTFYQL